MKQLFQSLVLSLLFLPAVLHADAVFQSPLQFRALDGELGSTHVMTLDGIIEESARLMPDIDGDGRAEWYFRSPDPFDPECDALNIAMSTNVFGSDFTSADLDRMMRIRRSRPVNDDGTVTQRCRFITAFSVLDDINGDGIGEITTSVNTVVLGTIQPGAFIDEQNFNSSEGFHLDSGSRPISVGDINGDGFNDFATDALSRIYAGRADFPTMLGASETSDDGLLFEITLNSRIKPIGDFNGDGFADLAVQGTSDSVRYASIIYGESNMGLRITEIDQILQNTINECSARICTIGPAGDFDVDGFTDLIVSARERFESNAESAIVYGASSGFPASETITTIPSNRKTMLFSAGGTNIFNRVNDSRVLNDINGDNQPEVLIEFNARDVVLFPTGKRAATLSVDTVDGSDGIFIESTNISTGDINYFIDDVDDDGFPDLSFSRFYLKGLDFPEPRTPQLDTVLRQSPGVISLYWQTVENADAYRISSDGREISTLPANIFFLLVDDPTRGDGGLLTIEAVDSAGVTLANVTRRIRPAADNPYNLRVDVYSGTLVELFFDGVDNRYLVLRDGEVIARHVYDTSFLDDTVEAGTSYAYTIRPDLRLNENDSLDTLSLSPGYQRTSATVTITTPGDNSGLDLPPTPPSNLAGVVYSDSALEITWTRSTSNKIITGYTVYRNGEAVATTAGNSYFDFALTPGTEYIYTVTATDILNLNSDPSQPVTLKTRGGLSNNILSTPTGLRAEIYSATVIELFWDRQQVAGVRYNLYQDDMLIANTDGTSFFVDELLADQRYTFALGAIDQNGTETERATLSVGDATSTAPATPLNVNAAVYGPRLVEIFWDRIPGQIIYNIYIDGSLNQSTDGTSTLLPLDGAPTRFDVNISAVNTAGSESALSESVSVTIK